MSASSKESRPAAVAAEQAQPVKVPGMVYQGEANSADWIFGIVKDINDVTTSDEAETEFVVDSGAEASVLSQREAARAGLQVHPTSETLYNVSGDSLGLAGQGMLQGDLGDEELGVRDACFNCAVGDTRSNVLSVSRLVAGGASVHFIRRVHPSRRVIALSSWNPGEVCMYYVLRILVTQGAVSPGVAIRT